MLLYGASGDTQLSAYFIERVPVTALKHEYHSRTRRKPGEDPVERLQASFEICTGERIEVCGEVLIGQLIDDVQCHRSARARQAVLVYYMTGHGQEIGFGAADLLEALDAQKSQEHLLREIRRISRVSETCREKATQTLAVLRSYLRDEVLLGLGNQVGSVGLVASNIRATDALNGLLYVYPVAQPLLP